MTNETKDYTMKFSVSVTVSDGSYNPPSPVRFEISEKLPRNLDAKAYLRKRLSEELDRAFAQKPVILNFEEEAKTTSNPLADDDIPF